MAMKSKTWRRSCGSHREAGFKGKLDLSETLNSQLQPKQEKKIPPLHEATVLLQKKEWWPDTAGGHTSRTPYYTLVSVHAVVEMKSAQPHAAMMYNCNAFAAVAINHTVLFSHPPSNHWTRVARPSIPPSAPSRLPSSCPVLMLPFSARHFSTLHHLSSLSVYLLLSSKSWKLNLPTESFPSACAEQKETRRTDTNEFGCKSIVGAVGRYVIILSK